MMAAIEAFRRRHADLSPLSPDVPESLGTREANRDELSPVSPLSPHENTIPASETAKPHCITLGHADESNEATAAHLSIEVNSERILSDGEKSALAIAERAIAQAALTDEQKSARLADSRRDPAIARFWAMAWPEVTNPSSERD